MAADMKSHDNRWYPIFLDIRDRPVLVVGAGKVALRKAKGLIEAGAKVTVVAPCHLPDFERLPARLIRRKFRAADLNSAALVFAATNDRGTNHRIAVSGKRRGILANIADARDECAFLIPARLRHGNIQIAVSTGATNPRISAQLRRKLEKVL
jgi:siroheme synthase-like protein